MSKSRKLKFRSYERLDKTQMIFLPKSEKRWKQLKLLEDVPQLGLERLNSVPQPTVTQDMSQNSSKEMDGRIGLPRVVFQTTQPP